MKSDKMKVFLILKEIRTCKKRHRYEELTCMLIDHYKDELTVAFEESIEDNKKYDDRELDNFIMNELHVTFNI